MYVKPTDQDYKACEHYFKLDLTKETSLKQRELQEISENTYKFKDFKEMPTGKVSVSQLVSTLIDNFDSVFLNMFFNSFDVRSAEICLPVQPSTLDDI